MKVVKLVSGDPVEAVELMVSSAGRVKIKLGYPGALRHPVQIWEWIRRHMPCQNARLVPGTLIA
ncbi:MAG: hypothetical protein CMM45_09145 [Rhodospirillaceae bacterium]|nr:hypothetical protein [Rhodospirillaceae bacterium]